MMIRPGRFNTYLLLAAAVLCIVGCETPESKQKKEISNLRIHLQVNADGTKSYELVSVFRASPVMINIGKSPLLTELHLSSAKLLDVMGGYSIQLQFNRAGIWLLEQYTTANKGRHLAIFSQFGETAAESRWLAAPLIQQRIADGVLTFTPDASREEADRIVRGLNNLVEQNKKKGL